MSDGDTTGRGAPSVAAAAGACLAFPLAGRCPLPAAAPSALRDKATASEALAAAAAAATEEAVAYARAGEAHGAPAAAPLEMRASGGGPGALGARATSAGRVPLPCA